MADPTQEQKKQDTALQTHAAQIAAKRAFRSKMKAHAVASTMLLSAVVVAFGALALGFQALSQINVTQTLSLQGRLQAVEQSKPIAHSVGGVVKELFVSEGEVVREGQLLVSLGTQDLDEAWDEARRDVSQMLLRAACLQALREGAGRVDVSAELKASLARLGQMRQMRRSLAQCEDQLETIRLDRLEASIDLAAAQDRANIEYRLAQVRQMSVRRDLGQAAIEAAPDFSAQEETLSQFLRSSAAFEALEEIKARALRHEAGRLSRIDAELHAIEDRLIKAQAHLSEVEETVNNRFVYASASGRIQRMRVDEAGKRIAAGAYIMEIAPLATDFEVMANASVLDIPQLRVGSGVDVRISGQLRGAQWVPAQVAEITKITANKRLVRIILRREDLAKRDLLFGDYTLNGLGAQSEALISVKTEPALQSLMGYVERHLLQKLPALAGI